MYKRALRSVGSGGASFCGPGARGHAPLPPSLRLRRDKPFPRRASLRWQRQRAVAAAASRPGTTRGGEADIFRDISLSLEGALRFTEKTTAAFEL